jgi:pyridinium-3,5-biscarboxylic acid mononucleotide synthase
VTHRWHLFDDFEAALGKPADRFDDGLRLDPRRAERAGVPEVVYAVAKRSEDVITALRRLAEPGGRAIASRCSAATINAIENALGEEFAVDVHLSTVVIHRADAEQLRTGGRIGLITAGTSDIEIATEARVMAEEMGCAVTIARDAGVAGLHRIVGPLRTMANDDVDVVIVAAGMDGALPSVIAGLVPVPVIGLPISTGYGFGGNGDAALGSMLQSCAPGLAVVNIDNGIGAGAIAALIANRAAEARRTP